MLHGSTRIPFYIKRHSMTLTQSYGVPYFGTRSKVVDFPLNLPCLQPMTRLSVKSVVRKILFFNALWDVVFSFIRDYFITLKAVCQEVIRRSVVLLYYKAVLFKYSRKLPRILIKVVIITHLFAVYDNYFITRIIFFEGRDD